MAYHTLIDTDETTDGLSVLFYTQSGKVFEADIDAIIEWIELNDLHAETGGYGLTSDPYSRDEVIRVDADEFYKENSTEINEQYFKQVINK